MAPDGLFDAEAWHFSTDAGLVDVVMSAAGVGDFDAHVRNVCELSVFGLTVKVWRTDELEMIVKRRSVANKDLSVLDQLRRLRDDG